VTTEPSPKRQFEALVDRFTPDVAKRARGAITRMRKLTPGAIEIVYDNYNALAIGFGPSERASEAIFSIALYPKHPSLFFLQGAKLPDPTKVLRGAGKVVRHIVIDDVKLFDDAAVRRLIEIALERAKVPLDPKQRRRLVIRSVSEKQRPRRPRDAW
jgi:hypothetical protein